MAQKGDIRMTQQARPNNSEAMERVKQTAAALGGGPGAHINYANWKRAHESLASENRKPSPEDESAEPLQPPPEEPPADGANSLASVLARLNELSAKANAGDRQALEELRNLLDEHPEVYRHVGNLAEIAENSWLDLIVEGNALGREATKRQLATLKANLAGEHPTPLEQLLVDNITVAYLGQKDAEIREACDSGGSPQQAAYRLKRSESAQRRYLAAIKTLATLRAKAPAGMAPLKGLKLHDPEQKVG